MLALIIQLSVVDLCHETLSFIKTTQVITNNYQFNLMSSIFCAIVELYKVITAGVIFLARPRGIYSYLKSASSLSCDAVFFP